MSISHCYSCSYTKEAWFAERYTNQLATYTGKAMSPAEGHVPSAATFDIAEAVCDLCGERRLVAVVDTSGDEYHSGTICEECLAAAFAKAREAQAGA
jgi:hypothetical protein